MQDRSQNEDIGKQMYRESHKGPDPTEDLHESQPESDRYRSETPTFESDVPDDELTVYDEGAGSEYPRSYMGSMLRFVIKVILFLLILPWGIILLLTWVPPPLSSFMILHRLTGHTENTRYRWIDWDSISPAVPLAVMASEDQRFMEHNGFDFDSIRTAWEEHRAGIRTRGASTISQQVAKNLFLWPGKDIIRKALEGYLTVIIELIWKKRRILEIYVNIAEFSPGIYGIGAASEILFNTAPLYLTADDAALMAAVLPNPSRLKIRNPSAYVLTRKDFIRNQMMKLGGIDLVKDL